MDYCLAGEVPPGGMKGLAMMIRAILLSIFLACIGTTNATADEIVKVDSAVVSDLFQASIPDELKNRRWNRWTTANFVVLSLNDGQAMYLHDNLEQIRSWLLTRWGLNDIKFGAECRIVCVDDVALFKQLFGLERSRVEVRRKNGRVEIVVAFLLLNDRPSRCIPTPLSEVCLSMFENEINQQFGWWLHRGMSLLNGSLADIRQHLLAMNSVLRRDEPIYFSQALCNIKEEEYNKLTADAQLMFDRSALLAVLMLRKEYGQDKFLFLLRDTSSGRNPETALRQLYGFASYDAFDRAFKQYAFRLTGSVAGDPSLPPTPNSYLQVIRGK